MRRPPARTESTRVAYPRCVIDTHCHLTFEDLRTDIAGLLDEAAGRGVTGAITISTTTRDCLDALAIAKAHGRVWCTAGVHPLYADKGPHEWANLRRVAEHPECVAWGELGLDNHYDRPPRDLQRRVLEEQLGHLERWRGEGVDLPIVLHCREAFDDLIPILKSTAFAGDRFVFHCFTGGPEEVRKCLDFGAMISFTGVVTYPNAQAVRDAAKLVPADRIMVETDAPFLAPAPNRGKRPCRIAWVRDTAEKLSQVRRDPFDEFHQRLNENTQRFFGIA
ncbi:MAG: TatD family deoxyribonuclease [Phycisphaerales bacterium]|nr:MAG: TatD family deoxyribonuclease [Phycisphaerales bacterium]